MKSIRLLFTLALFALSAPALQAVPLGPVSLKFALVYQAQPTAPSTLKTNISGVVTNVSMTSSVTTSNATIDNARFLAMLANSFNTNFPAGAALKIMLNNQIVVAVGSNIVLDAGVVLQIDPFEATVFSISQLTKLKLSSSPAQITTLSRSSQQGLATLRYNDSALPTRDGTTTSFSVTGMGTTQLNINTTPTSNIASFQFDFSSGTGRGNFTTESGSAVFVLEGGFRGSVSQTLRLPPP